MHNFIVMQIEKNILLEGSEGKPMPTDIFYQPDSKLKPVIIYAHGFNGFKDWGNFDIIAKQFAAAGFVFIKFNFSHNGTTPSHPEDFADLEAYGQNNYTKELHDLQAVIDWSLDHHNGFANNIDTRKLFLIGHSRGGGIVILKAAEEKKVKAIATWASVSECKTPWGAWNEKKMNEWKQTGVQYYLNSRTRQQMPLYYQLHEDYLNHIERLDILKAIKNLEIPVLICHGTNDEAVPVSKAHLLRVANPAATLFLVVSDHVFGRKHPWTEQGLPRPMQQVVDTTIHFFLNE
jgi:dienelactone hydrolase